MGTHAVASKDHVSGGSSSGSAVSVGADLATFSLATDTAGSGRVPAGFNNVVGFKPTRGLISFQGVTPACLSLDCIALIAKTVEDARIVGQVCEGFDPNDRYARDTFPLPRHVNSIGPQREAFQQLQGLGGVLTSVNWDPFKKAGDLLYEGTFVSERLASLPDDFLEKNAQYLHPVILELFEKVVARQSTNQFASADRFGVDVLVVPTAPEHPTIEAMLADPINLNAKLGTFTHFA